MILDFDYESARMSAVEDWKIDVEREKFDKEFDEKQRPPSQTRLGGADKNLSAIPEEGKEENKLHTFDGEHIDASQQQPSGIYEPGKGEFDDFDSLSIDDKIK